jgi:ribonuclease P protein component
LTSSAHFRNGPLNKGRRAWRLFHFTTNFIEDMSDEAHLSAEQSGPRTAARVPGPHGDSRRTCSDSRPPRARSQEAQRLTTITKRADFLAANAAKRLATPGFVLLIRKRDDGDVQKRLGITVTKKIGNAVIRNRMKRRFRALAHELITDGGVAGSDHVLIGRAGGVERDFGQLRSELEKALKRAAG